MKKFFFVITTVILIAVITFLFSEIILRIYVQMTPTMFAPRDKRYNQFRAAPNTWINGFQLNSKGFQDKEFTTQKPKETFRIIAIGDSFTFGVVPYENNFLTLLEDSLKEKNSNLEILNMGIPSMGVREYLSLLVDEGLALNPDMLLVNIYIGNDISEANEKPKESPFITIRFLKYMNAYFQVAKKQPRFRGGQENTQNLYKDDEVSMEDFKFEATQRLHFKVYLENKFVIKHLQPNFISVKKDLDTIKKICESKNIKLLIALLPSETQVDSNLQRVNESMLNETHFRVFDSYENLVKSVNYSLPNILLRKELNDLNIDYIDLLDVFQEKGKTMRLYKPKDTHWNIPGNKLAAETIYNYMINKNIIQRNN